MKQNTYLSLILLAVIAISTNSYAQPSGTDRIEMDNYTLMGRSVYRYQNKVYRGYQISDVRKTNPQSVNAAVRSRKLQTAGIALTITGGAITVYGLSRILSNQGDMTPFIVGPAFSLTGSFLSWESRRQRQISINQFNTNALERLQKKDTVSKKRPWNEYIYTQHNEFGGRNNYLMGNQPIRRRKVMELMRTDRDAKPFAALVAKNSKATIISSSIAAIGFITLRLLQPPGTDEIPSHNATAGIISGTIATGGLITAIITGRAARRAEINGVKALNGDDIIPFNRTHRNLGKQNLSLHLGTGNYGLGLVAKW